MGSGMPESERGAVDTVVALVLSRSTDTVEQVRARFAEAGFACGPASGPTFAIEAPTRTFEQVFGALPEIADDGGWTTDGGDELPLSPLPQDLRDQLVAVALERPVELHADGAGPQHDRDADPDRPGEDR